MRERESKRGDEGGKKYTKMPCSEKFVAVQSEAICSKQT